jgi:chromosomal replication initiation ATPase DnaA
MTNYQRAIRLLGEEATEAILAKALEGINKPMMELEAYQAYIESFYILKRTWKDYECRITPVRSMLIHDLLTSRKQEVVAVKYSIAKHLRTYLSQAEVGIIFNTDHSTILKGIRSFNGHLESGDELSTTAWNKLQEFLKQNNAEGV